MSNPQKIKFNSVSEFLAHLPEDELIVVETLLRLVRDTIPDVRIKLAYNVPFFYRHRRIGFIWPASVPWGKVSAGVALGFVNGHQWEAAEATDSQVSRRVYHRTEEIDEDTLTQALWEAAELDRQQYEARSSS